MSAEAVPDPPGRVFAETRRAGLADAGPTGRVRLDAIARWLQDVAYADVADAGLAERALWVLRRVTLRVDRFPEFAEHLTLRTACTGVGRMWAERTTSVTGERGRVEAVALWVSLDPETGRPLVLGESFAEVYASSAAGRRVKARLHHPAPSPGAPSSPWVFRRSDLDLAGHVNNAAYWQPLEEELLAGPDPVGADGELEFKGGATAGPAEVQRDGERWWFSQGGALVASARLVPR